MLRDRNPFQRWIIPLVLALAMAPVFLHNLDDLQNFSGDETLWLAVSNKLFRLFVVEHDFGHSAWREEFSTFGSRQPQIGKYLIGIGTYAAGYSAEPYTPYRYNWGRDLSWNRANGGVPPAHLVAAGRLPVALLGIGACLVFYWLIALVTNPWTATLATVGMVQGGLLAESSRRAMIDTPALAFGLLALVGMVYTLRALRRQQPRRAAGAAALAGLACGLAVGTKLNTLLILAVCALTLLGEAALAPAWRGRRLPLLCLALVAAGTALVVYIANPFLHVDVLAGLRHQVEMGYLVATIPFDQLTTPAARVLAVWQSTLDFGPFARMGLPIDRWLLLAGLVALAARGWQHRAELRAQGLDLLLVWIAVSYIGITVWLPHAWARYYLPLQPCNAFVEAYGLLWLLSSAFVRSRRLFAGSQGAPRGIV
jgi:4-amino-4-deoxy-L-arabinose transferase-like glycosyltransferase